MADLPSHVARQVRLPRRGFPTLAYLSQSGMAGALARGTSPKLPPLKEPPKHTTCTTTSFWNIYRRVLEYVRSLIKLLAFGSAPQYRVLPEMKGGFERRARFMD